MCFPYRRAIMRSTLEPDPYRYAAHGLRNNESLFIFFFICRAPSIAKVTRLSSRCGNNGSPTQVLLVKDAQSRDLQWMKLHA